MKLVKEFNKIMGQDKILKRPKNHHCEKDGVKVFCGDCPDAEQDVCRKESYNGMDNEGFGVYRRMLDR